MRSGACNAFGKSEVLIRDLWPEAQRGLRIKDEKDFFS